MTLGLAQLTPHISMKASYICFFECNWMISHWRVFEPNTSLLRGTTNKLHAIHCTLDFREKSSQFQVLLTFSKNIFFNLLIFVFYKSSFFWEGRVFERYKQIYVLMISIVITIFHWNIFFNSSSPKTLLTAAYFTLLL